MTEDDRCNFNELRILAFSEDWQKSSGYGTPGEALYLFRAVDGGYFITNGRKWPDTGSVLKPLSRDEAIFTFNRCAEKYYSQEFAFGRFAPMTEHRTQVQDMAQIVAWVPKEQAQWLTKQEGLPGEVISFLIEKAMAEERRKNRPE
ncbi:MAG: hypothetical protein AAGU05_02440 [Anaerolineaceae bacterium]